MVTYALNELWADQENVQSENDQLTKQYAAIITQF